MTPGRRKYIFSVTTKGNEVVHGTEVTITSYFRQSQLAAYKCNYNNITP